MTRTSASREAIVVTGASSGIGAAVAELAAERGFIVFAGVRRAEDAQRIAAAHALIRPLIIDVTDSASIERAVQEVAASGAPLRGIVNNAGISVAGPLEVLPIDHVRRQFEVNVFGQLAVAQAFLPQLRATRGRIVFVGSIAGRLAPPFVGPYAASKFALRALSDTLRIELHHARIKVSLIEPGAVKTPIWQKGRDAKDAMIAQIGDHPAVPHYSKAIDRVVDITQHQERIGLPATHVAEVVLRALTARKPKAHYLVGPEAKVQSVVALLPASIRDRIIRKRMGL